MTHKNKKALDSFGDSPDMGVQEIEDDSKVHDKGPDDQSGYAPDDYSGDENGPLLLDMTGNDDSHPPEEDNAGPPQESPRWTNVTAGEDVAIPNDVLKTRLAKVQDVFGPLPLGRGEGADEGVLPPGEQPDPVSADICAPQPDLIEDKGRGLSAENLAEGFRLLADKMDFLASEFSGKLKYDSHKDKVIDALHKELQEYKGDIVKKNMQSMVMDLIKIIDDIRKITLYYQAREAEMGDVPKLINAMEGISQDIEEVLNIRGVEAVVCEEDTFLPSIQRALRLVPTAEPSQDKIVAYRIAPGFEWEGRILRKEMVAVYTFNQENGKNSEP
ncbi:MAG: nucleotide exchange factor GrpE [Desulfatibacillaceae bacterium]|nr:nucleotide exchange factor GrpE [Desulfatibacillaceae bacterium]